MGADGSSAVKREAGEWLDDRYFIADVFGGQVTIVDTHLDPQYKDLRERTRRVGIDLRADRQIAAARIRRTGRLARIAIDNGREARS